MLGIEFVRKISSGRLIFSHPVFVQQLSLLFMTNAKTAALNDWEHYTSFNWHFCAVARLHSYYTQLPLLYVKVLSLQSAPRSFVIILCHCRDCMQRWALSFRTLLHCKKCNKICVVVCWWRSGIKTTIVIKASWSTQNISLVRVVIPPFN